MLSNKWTRNVSFNVVRVTSIGSGYTKLVNKCLLTESFLKFSI